MRGLRTVYNQYFRLLACNDFFESFGAAQQNIAVIPAFLTVSKRPKTYPIALTSNLIAHLRTMICGSCFPILDVPDEMLAGYYHDLGQYPGQTARLIPSFGFGRGS